MKDHDQKDIHMINDGEYSYIWGKGIATNTVAGEKANQGFKMKNDDDNQLFVSDISIEDLKKEDFKALALVCKSWKADSKMLKFQII